MMKKNLLKVVVCTLVALSANAIATDFRAPLTTAQGPLHYKFKKVGKKKWLWDFWSAAYMKEADKAYMKHGTQTQPLTALFFGKSDFTLAESFQGATDSGFGLTENQNPYLSVAKFSPRASYTESGINLGGQVAYPVWGKGKVGLRGVVPFKTIRVERDDEAEAVLTAQNDVIIRNDARYNNTDKAPVNNIISYKLDLIKKIQYFAADGSITCPLGYKTTAEGSVEDGKTVIINGKSYDATSDVLDTSTTGLVLYGGDKVIPFVVVKSPTAGKPPYGLGGAVLSKKSTSTDKFELTAGPEEHGTSVSYPDADTALVPLTLDGNVAANKAAVFCNNVGDYRTLKTDDLWLTTIHAKNGEQLGTSEAAVTFIDKRLAAYDSNMTNYLLSRGYVFQTAQTTGLGDVDLFAFYEHTFCDSWKGELNFGVRFPTGVSNKYYGNPYKQQLGNGGHVELKLGGMAAWQALKWMNVKADISYSFALQATEKRIAAYKGATIKNVGPKADADVDYSYFLGKLDLNLWHPKTKELSTTVGYELYYKTEDHINFKNKDATDHFLGKQWVSGTNQVADITNTIKGTQWKEFAMTLDNAVARKNSETIAHRAHVETTYYANKYFDFFIGGAYTFAGQNAAREAEGFGGMHVRF